MKGMFRIAWPYKILPQTDVHLEEEVLEILTPIYKEIGYYVMSYGWQRTSNRPILNVMEKGS